MAKFVLAGRADCLYYAKAELLADYLQKNLPHFRVHKITQNPDDWEQWLMELCEKNGWKHKRSPIIWRELLDRGGKGLLLGGFNDFMEHAQQYYNFTLDMMTGLMKDIAVENIKTCIEVQKEEEELQSLFNPMHVWVTSASAPTCYSLIPMLANGEIFGLSKEIWLHLLDSSHCKDTLQALVMEAEDLAFPLLRKITMHTLSDDTFLQADFVIVLDDAFPMNDKSPETYIKEFPDQYIQYGTLIDQNANKGVKVVVAGSSYVNLKALVIMSHAPSIDQHNVVALPTQLEFEAKAQIATKLNVKAAEVKDVIVWGNISGIKHLDLHQAKIYNYDSAVWGPPHFSRSLLNVIYDSNWVKKDLTEWSGRWQHRSGMSAAHCVAKVLSCWQEDSTTEEIVSLGVISEGQFKLPEGIVYSLPVQFQNGKWQVYNKTTIPEEAEEKLTLAANELIKEKETVFGVQQDAQIIIEECKEDDVIESEAVISTAISSDAVLPTMENPSDEND
ncbi:putative malate dehydrogenase 1B isoform X1 [Ascaphus truei]|uniref:putative malate dehydrogenase 1B isoform X1 n=2 Tax=Ascaphus truei TaxID=8439 RepID=UPI003F5ACCD9